MPGDFEKLAYDSALRALDKQERLVEELRARAGVVLASSSLAVSFLGSRVFSGVGSVGLAAVALLSFALSVGATVFVLTPWHDLTFSLPASDVMSNLFDFCDDPDELLHRAADVLDRFWDQNDTAVRRIGRAFSLAAVALGVEVVALAALAALLGGTIL